MYHHWMLHTLWLTETRHKTVILHVVAISIGTHRYPTMTHSCYVEQEYKHVCYQTRNNMDVPLLDGWHEVCDGWHEVCDARIQVSVLPNAE